MGAAGVVTVDIRDECPAALSQHVSGDSQRLVYIAGDVSQEQTAERMTSEAREQFGRIDIMLNNAGVSVVKPCMSTHPTSGTR